MGIQISKQHESQTARLKIKTLSPLCLIANTVKGKGVSFMENNVEWHHKAPTPEQFLAALKEYD